MSGRLERQVFLVSDCASDRSTGYTMSNRLVRVDGRLFCCWLDDPSANWWGCVDEAGGRGARARARVRRLGILGHGTDNHCGVASVRDHGGAVHVVLGAHHGTFAYRRLDDPMNPAQATEAVPLGQKATHPSLVCDRAGVLHLAYRSSTANPWLLQYQRKVSGQPWSEPITLAVAATAGYTTWTNALAVGPDNRLHLVLGVYRLLDGGDAYYGAAHIFSDDGGHSWRQFGGSPLPLPVDITQLDLIEHDALQPHRILPAERLAEVNQTHERASFRMVLSNPVVDAEGRPWVIVHNTLNQSAALYGAREDRWHDLELDTAVRTVFPGFGIAAQSALSRHADGTLEAVVMAVPRGVMAWGAPQTELIRILLDPVTGRRQAALVHSPDSTVAHWIPNIEQWSWSFPFQRPALLYTRGLRRKTNTPSLDDSKTSPSAVWLNT